MIRQVVSALVLAGVLITAGSVAATQVTAPIPAAPMLAVPDEPGAWLLHIVTRGGITGQMRREIIILSDGRIVCGQPAGSCAPMTAPDALGPLQDQVRLASIAAWQTLQPASVCSDCPVTELVLTSRNADGTLKTLRTSWDPTTRAALAAAITRAHDLAARLAQPLTR